MTHPQFRSAGCPQEDSVARAARTGLWNEPLRGHLQQCATCRAVAAAAGLMRELAKPTAEETALPQASLLWWKYELAQRYARGERARRPIRVMEFLSAGLLVLAVYVALAWAATSAPDAAAWTLSRTAPRFLELMLWESVGGSSGLVLFALVPAMVTLAAAAGLVYPLLREQ